MTAQLRAAVAQAGSAECKKQAADQVEWVPSGWDDPRAVHLRSLMDEELRPRYAPLEAAGRPRWSSRRWN